MTNRRFSRSELLRGLGWFVLASAALFKLITLVFWSGVVEPPEGVLAFAYRALSNFAHWPLLAGLLVGVPVALVIVLMPRLRLVAASACLFGAAACILVLVDAVVFAQYRMHLGSYVWGLLLGGAGKATFIFSPLMWALILALIAGAMFLFALAYLGCWRLARRLAPWKLGAKLWPAWALALVGLNLWHAWADAQYQANITRESGYLPFYYPLTAKRTLRKWGLVDPTQADQDVTVRTDLKSTLHYPQEPLQCRDGAKANVMLIVVDAWRADQLDTQVTPRMHDFAAETMRFRHHVSGGNVTRFGIFSIFYALPGNYWFPILRTHTPPVLMREVVRQNYDLAILGSAPLVHPEFNQTVFSGIEGLRLSTPGDRPVERDRRVSSDMVAFLDDPARRAKPFFGFLWLNSVHSYDVPDDRPQPFQPSWDQINYLALNKDFDPTPYFNRYKNALHFADDEVGKVLEALRRNGLMDDTFVILTSDHGEEFNDTGKNYWGHNGNFSPYQVRVPLMVRWPAWGGGEVNYVTTHYDLVPTVLDEIFGCTTPPSAYSIGLPLRQAENRRSFVPVVDYNDTGIYEPDQVTVFSNFGGFPVYNHDYDRLDRKPRSAVIGAVTQDMLRFSRKPGRPATSATTTRK